MDIDLKDLMRTYLNMMMMAHEQNEMLLYGARRAMPMPGEDPPLVSSFGPRADTQQFGLNDYLNSSMFTEPRALMDSVPIQPLEAPARARVPDTPRYQESESLVTNLINSARFAMEPLGELFGAAATGARATATELTGRLVDNLQFNQFDDIPPELLANAPDDIRSLAENGTLFTRGARFVAETLGINRLLHDQRKAAAQAARAQRASVIEAFQNSGLSPEAIERTATGAELVGGLIGGIAASAPVFLATRRLMGPIPTNSAVAGRMTRGAAEGLLTTLPFLSRDDEFYSTESFGDFASSRVGQLALGAGLGALSEGLFMLIGARRANRGTGTRVTDDIPEGQYEYIRDPQLLTAGETPTGAIAGPRPALPNRPLDPDGPINLLPPGDQPFYVEPATNVVGSTGAIERTPGAVVPFNINETPGALPINPRDRALGAIRQGAVQSYGTELGTMYADLVDVMNTLAPRRALNFGVQLKQVFDSGNLAVIQEGVQAALADIRILQNKIAPAVEVETAVAARVADVAPLKTFAPEPAPTLAGAALAGTQPEQGGLQLVVEQAEGYTPEQLLPYNPQRFVQEMGTVIDIPLYRGGTESYEELDVMTGVKWQVAGQGVYATSDPRIASGGATDVALNPNDPRFFADPTTGERSYASRAASRQEILLQELQGIRNELSTALAEGRGNANSLELRLGVIDREISRIGTNAPSTLKLYAAVRNVLDFDAPASPEIFEAMRREVLALRPEAAEQLNAITFLQEPRNVKYYYNQISEVLGEVGGRRGLTLNPALINAGYDAIKFNGSLGSMPDHDVYNILDKRFVVPAVSMDETIASGVAQARAIEKSKRAALIESPIVANIAKFSDMSDADVAKAQFYTNVFSYQLVPNVENPQQFTQLVNQSMPERTVTLFNDPRSNSPLPSAIVTGNPLNARQITELNEYGAANQLSIRFVSKDGLVQTKKIVRIYDEGEVVKTKRGDRKMSKGTATLVDPTDSPELRGDVMQLNLLKNPNQWSLVTDGIEDMPTVTDELWDDFMGFYAAYGQALELDTGQPVNIFTDEGTDLLPAVANAYLEASGIEGTRTRASIVAALENRLQKTYRDMVDPEVMELLRTANVPDAIAIMDEVATLAEAANRPMTIGDALVYNWAANTGFEVVPEPATGGWLIRDLGTAEVVSVADNLAAVEFLKNAKASVEPVDLPGTVSLKAFPEVVDSMIQRTTDAPDATEGEATLAAMAQADAESALEAVGLSPTEAVELAAMPPSEPPPPSSVDGGSGGDAPDGGGPVVLGATPRAVTTDAPTRPFDANLQAALSAYGQASRSILGRWFSWVDPIRETFSDLQALINARRDAEGRPLANSTLLNDYDLLYRQLNKASAAGEPALKLLQAADRNADGVAKRNGTLMKKLLHPGQYDESVSEYLRVVPEIFGDDWLAVWPQFQLYMQRLNRMQAQGDYSPESYRSAAEGLPNITWWAEHAARRGLNTRVLNPTEVLNSLTHVWNFGRYAGDIWRKNHDAYMQLFKEKDQFGNQPAAAIASEMVEWLDLVRDGVPRDQRGALEIAYSFSHLNKVMTPAEFRSLMRGLSTTFTKAIMGGRLYPLLRDANQPLLAVPYVGLNNMRKAYQLLLNAVTPAGRAELQNTIGYMKSQGMFVVEAPRFSTSVEFDADQLAGGTDFSPTGMQVRETTARIMGAAENATPWLVKLLADKMLSPYAKMGVVNRIVTSKAAMERFNEVIGNQSMMLAGSESSLARMLDDLRIFEQAERENIGRMISQGSMEDAMASYVLMVTDKTQGRYGARYAGRLGRTTGGQFWTKLGTFDFMLYNLLRRQIATGYTGARELARGLGRGEIDASALKRARFTATSIVTHGALYLALAKLGAAVGTSLLGWHPLQSLFGWFEDKDSRTRKAVPYLDNMIGGNPLGEALGLPTSVDMFNALAGNRPDYNPSVAQQLQNATPGSLGLSFAQKFTPFGGLVDMAQIGAQSMQGQNPMQDFMLYMTTGERSFNATENFNRAPQTTQQFNQLEQLMRNSSSGNGSQ